jgi:hypothetical protein
MSEELDLTDEQIDALVNAETPLNQTMPDKEVPEETKAPEFAPVTFTANGKEVVAEDPEKLKKWASMGYNYGQHMEQFKKEQDELNTKMNDYESKYSLYEKIDKAAAENPQWWEHVQNSYNQSQGNTPSTPQQEEGKELSPEIQALKEQFNTEMEDLRKFKSDILAERNAKKMEEEDTKLKGEIGKIREAHGDLDWTTPNADGKTLEYRILEHANNNGINSFDIAFKHFMHDELVNKAKQTALDAARKEIQRNTKLGLLGETPDPLKKYTEESNSRNKSWDDVEKDALKELGIAN